MFLYKLLYIKQCHTQADCPAAPYPGSAFHTMRNGAITAAADMQMLHVCVDVDPYFTDDLTDQALRMVREVRSGHPTRPWFLYCAHGAVHAPLQVKADDAGKYRGRYGQGRAHV